MLPHVRPTDALSVAVALACLAIPTGAFAAGFEVGEHTTLSTARGGTGIVSKNDPSALYFNPSLLPTAEGFQSMVDFGVVDYNLTFERDDLVYREGNRQRRRSHDKTVENQTPFTPAPSAGFSYDFGLENFGAGIGVFAPHGAQKRCYGELENGTCKVDRDGPGRHMLVYANLVEVYAMAGAGYEFDLPEGSLRIGASGIAAHQKIDFKIVVNSQLTPKAPWDEEPENESVINATDLTSWNFLGVFGLSYEHDGFRVAASYRPPTRWKSTGTGTVDFPDGLDDLGVELTDPKMTFVTWQAGSLRLGWRYAQGTHPGRPDEPKFDLEVNGVYEDWSRVKQFELRPEGDVVATEADGARAELRPFVQRKNWRDTFSLRFGGSWGALPWLTLHGGTFFETAAVPLAYTHLDFGSWERVAGSLGASFHPTDWLDLKLGFMHIASPTRRVRDGEIYNKVPTSPCSGPDYTDDACSAPGQPPGNPQNEGVWNVNYNIASVGVTLRFQ